MRRALFVWALCSVVGAFVVALPDDGRRLVSLSEAHGPSRLDALGIAFLLVGWVVFATALWQRRARLLACEPSGLLVGAFVAGLGLGLMVASVVADYPYWWVLGAGTLIVVQLLAALAVLHRGSSA